MVPILREACDADDQTEDLIATARALDSVYMEWRRLHRADIRRAQDDVLARTAASRLARARHLYEDPHRSVALLKEWVLHSRIGTGGR